MAHESETRDLLAHVLLPVAGGVDALATAAALAPRRPGRVPTHHDAEGGDPPDETPVVALPSGDSNA